MQAALLTLHIVASTYGSGGYGEEAYSSGVLDSLANTGWDVLIPVFAGVSLVAAGVLYFVRRWWRGRRSPKLSQK